MFTFSYIFSVTYITVVSRSHMYFPTLPGGYMNILQVVDSIHNEQIIIAILLLIFLL